MDQLIVTLQNDVSCAWKAMAQEAAFIHQQLDHLLGNIPAVPQAGSGSGSGGGTMMTALNAQNQQSKIVTPQAGGGSGSGATATVHENASLQRIMPLASSGSGIGSGSGTGTVSGEVWLDNDGDGSQDNGELGFTGITVNLINPSTGQVVGSEITDDNGDYQFTAIVLGGSTSYQIQVVLPDGDEATTPGESQIDANGFSQVFALADGGNQNIKGGIRSTVVTTTQDNPPNGVVKDHVTLQDAIKTSFNNGKPVTFKDGVNGTISLQAKLPDLIKNITINGSGHTITVQGNGNANNPYRIFTIDTGVTAEIDSLTITGGYATGFGGGGIVNSGNLTLIGDYIYNNHAVNTKSGGGILNWTNANLTLNNTTVANNDADTGGGGIENMSTLTASSSTISQNTAEGPSNGGGIDNSGKANLTNCNILLNSATQGGGVENAGTFTMNGGTISSNGAGAITGKGGGLYNSSGSVTLTAVNVENNSANIGAGMYLAVNSSTSLEAVTVGAPLNNILIGATPKGQGIYEQNGAQLIIGDGVNDADDPDGQPVQGP
ncbi:MAG TPA: SdrD B-like domain-containing protein [Gemmataceae bacterium]